MLGALVLSAASHTSRGGLPKEVKNSDFTCVSGNWSARVPAEKPLNTTDKPPNS